MRKIICLLLLFVLPFSLSAKIKIDKAEMIQKAEDHRMKAISEIYFAENMCLYIPNLKDRRHLEALLAGTAASLQSKDPYNALLTIGLTLIGSLTNSMFEKYYEFRSHLIKADYHMELFDFYNTISLKQNPHVEFHTKYSKFSKNYDPGTDNFLNGIDHLTLAILTARCIREREVRDSVLNVLMDYRTRCLKNMKASAELSEDLYENIGEITSECEDNQLILEIQEQIHLLYECMDSAEYYWKGGK